MMLHLQKNKLNYAIFLSWLYINLFFPSYKVWALKKFYKVFFCSSIPWYFARVFITHFSDVPRTHSLFSTCYKSNFLFIFQFFPSIFSVLFFFKYVSSESDWWKCWTFYESSLCIFLHFHNLKIEKDMLMVYADALDRCQSLNKISYIFFSAFLKR